MEKLDTLKLSKKELDTSMAREYIQNINKYNEWPDTGQFFVEKKLEINKIDSIKNLHPGLFGKETITNVIDTGKNLAKKIEDNAEMFVQLEYLARGTDARDVRDGHINLMSQLARCCSAHWVRHWTTSLLHFTETMPLYNLASVVRDIYNDSMCTTAIVIENKNMKPLVKFFVQLCHDVGLHIPLVYANPSDIEELKRTFSFWSESSDNVGCTGVIAERADLDSAIDVFINSSVTAPWRLKQIYVQESIFEDFKVALAAKLRPDNKTFLIECLDLQQAGMPVHAYRTSKELLSLIRTPYLSLWAAETALSHEIALRTPACTVWVNEYATFHGPPRTALSVYDISYPTNKTYSNKLKETLKSWAQRRASDRLEVIVAVLEASKDNDAKDLLPDFTLKWCSDDLLHVTDKTVCFGIQKKLRVYMLPCEVLEKKRVFRRLLKVLINGNAVRISGSFDNCFVNELQRVGAPVEMTDSSDGNLITCSMIMERLKVIRTNYGTIFAN